MRFWDIGLLVTLAVVMLIQMQLSPRYHFKPIATFNTVPRGSAPPLLVDIDDGGHPELLLCGLSGSESITLIKWVGNKLTRQGTVRLSSFNGVRPSAHILHMSVGTIEKDNPEKFVVVVTNHLNVIVLDSSLSLVWSSNVPQPLSSREDDYEPPHYEIAVISHPVPLWTGDKGVIIVGLRPFDTREEEESRWSHESDYLEPYEQYEDEEGNVQEVEKNPMDINMDKNQFSYYAFESSTGSLRWKHQHHNHRVLEFEDNLRQDNYGDYNEGSEEGNVVRDHHFMSDHSWKLHMASLSNVFSERSWTEFKESILSLLPHEWYGLSDSHLSLLELQLESHPHVARSLSSLYEKTGDKEEEVEEVSWEEEVGLGRRNRKQKHHDDEAEYEYLWQNFFIGDTVTAKKIIEQKKKVFSTKKSNEPLLNAVALHSSLGLDIIHLYTGRPLTSLPLRSHATYMDLNQDHSVDQIWTRVGSRALHHLGVLTASGNSLRKIERFSVDGRETMSRGVSGSKVSGEMEGEDSDLRVADESSQCVAFFGSGVPHAKTIWFKVPLCKSGEESTVGTEELKHRGTGVRSWLKGTGSESLNGVGKLHFGNHQVIFLLNSGTLTSVGVESWQIQIASTWKAASARMEDDTTEDDELLNSGTPTSLVRYPLQIDTLSTNTSPTHSQKHTTPHTPHILVVGHLLELVSPLGEVELTYDFYEKHHHLPQGGGGSSGEGAVAVGDVDGDGLSDVVVRTRGGYVVLLLQPLAAATFLSTLLWIGACVSVLWLMRAKRSRAEANHKKRKGPKAETQNNQVVYEKKIKL